VKNDYVRTYVARDEALDVAVVAHHFEALTGQAAAALHAEGFRADAHRFARTADLRYYGQAFEVRVPVGDGPFDRRGADTTVAAFHDAHESLYGYCFRDRPEQRVEWVNLRVTGVGPIRRPEPRPLPGLPGGAERARTSHRPVYFTDGYARTPVYWRPNLAPGDVLEGPAVIEEYGATVPLHPGFAAKVDDFGNLVVTR
jgi:N-methylhydantoinase A